MAALVPTSHEAFQQPAEPPAAEASRRGKSRRKVELPKREYNLRKRASQASQEVAERPERALSAALGVLQTPQRKRSHEEGPGHNHGQSGFADSHSPKRHFIAMRLSGEDGFVTPTPSTVSVTPER